MVDFLSAINASVLTLTGAVNILKTTKELRGSKSGSTELGELNARLLEAQDFALSAQKEGAALVKRVGALEEELARVKGWEAEKAKYELRPVRTGEYAPLAYALKGEHDSPAPTHQLCTNCYERGEKSLLQAETRNPGRCHVLVCHRCGMDLYVHGQPEPEHARIKRR